MIPSIDAANCEGEEILLLLMHHLPPEVATLWHGCDDMLTMLREGGITCYTTLHQISDRIRSQQLFNVESNKFRKKRWFALHEKKDFSAPKQQLASKKQRPQIEPNYFTNLGIKFKFIKTSKAQTTTNTTATNTTASTTATNNNSTTTTANNNNNNNVNSSSNNNNNNNNNKTKQSRSCRPEIPSTETGFFISRFDLVDDIAAAAADHRKNCPRDLIKNQRKSGFEVFFEMECNFNGCKKKYHIRSGPKPAEEPSQTKTPSATQAEKQQRGPKVNQLNMIMTSAAHKSAIPVSHFLDFCHEVGCVSPSEKGLQKMLDKRKYAVKTVAEEVIRANRREHVAMAKKLYGKDNEIQHKDADGKVHNITRGAACADGAGDKRAYNHRITGSMHSTVVFSMLTGKVIAVRHDQVSCGLCDRQLTKLLNLNKRADEITDEDLKHDGECSRNSKHDPAVAEEYACELIARETLLRCLQCCRCVRRFLALR